MDGLPCIGLVSITCMVDKNTNKLHHDIIRIIERCKVKRVVWLIDADFREISSKEIENGANLTRRPDAFFNTIVRFQELLSSVEDISIYFAHITEDIDGKPKGLDDLLIAYKERKDEIVQEAMQFDKINQGMHNGNYFVKFNITQSPYKVKKHFLLNDVTLFYLHHIERRPELKGKNFKFYNSTYEYSEKTGKCEIKVPRDASNYFRVGDDYYEYIQIPNRYGELTKTFHHRQKSTIIDDHSKSIIQHIDKYKAFCNVPNHLNYQRVINNCFNTYAPFLHEPEDGEFEMTFEFIKHIFGTNTINVKGKEISYYELGLDYLQLLLKKPQQILPILCLVSKERQTGKTTFAKWLKLLFTENMAIVGNQDIGNDFNAHWTTKLLVCVDETKIEKEFVVEKIKSLSTSNNAMLNAKSKNQIEVETFLKFILLSNNEDNFINIDKEEIRFWVLKVPPIINKKILELEKILLDEIPYFINFLNKRKLATESEERHWFKTDYLQTEILMRIKENSLPTVWKILSHTLQEKFLDFPDYEEIRIPLKELKIHYLNNLRFDENYIEKVLKERGYEREHNQRGSFPTKYDTDSPINNSIDIQKFQGRPFLFKRKDFVSDAEKESDTPKDEELLF